MESPIKRRVSTARLQSPLPATDVAQGMSAISRLEDSAEELSAGGSDIGEALKKMVERERSLSRSRQSSFQSSHQGEFRDLLPPRRINSVSDRSRTSSYSYANSVVDARSGGYINNHITSPISMGSITSPIGSVRSRAASGSIQSSRLGQMEPMQEGRPLDSPLAPSSASLYSQEHAISRQASQSSFARRYDHIAEQIEESLATIPSTPPVEEDSQMNHDPIERPPSADTFQEAEIAFRDFDGVHYNPDTEEYVELDQDGQEIRRISARTSSGTLTGMAQSQQRQSRPVSSGRPLSYRPFSMALGAPPPGEDMVYYPAPVPRMLNLPKRLSQLPPAHVQAKRRSEMLQAMPRENRESAPWIPPVTVDDQELEHSSPRSHARSGSGSTTHQEASPRGMLNQRMSRANMQSLPPQLRASMFFQHPPVEHDVQVQAGSAVATLDAILESSANAPVTAFTDHPYAGDVRRTVYAPEKPLHSRTNTAEKVKAESSRPDLKKRRSSIGNFFRRNSMTLDAETEAQEQARPRSRGSMLDFGGSKLRKTRSQMSLGQMSAGDDLDRAVRTPGEERSDPIAEQPEIVLGGGEQIDQDFRDEKEREDWDHEDPVYAQPSTLLAELQVRKAQLKSRNRTAATAFPNGMHSTLLQLDAVEAIEQRKRQKKKISLAWEDHQGLPDDNSDDDRDDVPLGMLYPTQKAGGNRRLGDERDWSRPLGLMERRELEENEALGHRRSRLNPNARPLTRGNTMSQIHLAGQPDMPSEDEHENETLGERVRRLKRKEALDDAISDIHRDGQERDNSFTDELVEQFGGGLQVTNPDATVSDKSTLKEAASKAASMNAVDEEETLGQRAARLKREREASGESQPSQATRPPTMLRSSSMANLLSEYPVGAPPPNNMRASSYNLAQPPVESRPRQSVMPGGLIGNESSRPANGLYAGARRTSAINTSASNVAFNRSTSFGGLLGQAQSRPANGLFNPAGAWNAGVGGLQPSPSMPMLAGQGYFASPTAGMNYGGYGAQMGYPPYMQQMINPSAYQMLNGDSRMSMMMPPGYGYAPQQQMPFPGQSTMAAPTFAEPANANSIERWRQNVAPA